MAEGVLALIKIATYAFWPYIGSFWVAWAPACLMTGIGTSFNSDAEWYNYVLGILYIILLVPSFILIPVGGLLGIISFITTPFWAIPTLIIL